MSLISDIDAERHAAAMWESGSRRAAKIPPDDGADFIPARTFIDTSLTVGGPPNLLGIRRLAWEGFVTLMDLRAHAVDSVEQEEAEIAGLLMSRASAQHVWGERSARCIAERRHPGGAAALSLLRGRQPRADAGPHDHRGDAVLRPCVRPHGGARRAHARYPPPARGARLVRGARARPQAPIHAARRRLSARPRIS